MPQPASVALVHDYLNQCGGAERVALELAKLWPDTSVYTSLYRPDSTFAGFRSLPVTTTGLQRLPVDDGFRALAPLYPFAFQGLGTLPDEVVISSSSGWAHSVATSPESLHVVYCHTPARWLYRCDEYLGRRLGSALLSPFLSPLRRWDVAAARRADLYVVNSEHVRDRVRAIYRRDSHVINPPVDVGRFAPSARGQRLLVVSRLLPYKRIDLVVRAATRVGLGLDVVGTGPSLRHLREIAGPSVAFHGRLDDGPLQELLEGCRALCVAATEDFGIAAIEAGAAGKPVVAYGAGGALETLQDGVNGTLFGALSEDSLLTAIRRADTLEFPPTRLAALARRFSPEAFRMQVKVLIGRALAQRAERNVARVRASTRRRSMSRRPRALPTSPPAQ